MERVVSLVLGGREFTAARARLGGFLRLQGAYRAVREAGDKGDNGALADALYAHLSAGLAPADLDRGLFEAAPWFEVVSAFLILQDFNAIPNADNLAILQTRGGKPVPWDHPLRQAIMWIHLIASRYGWSRESIEHLWPEEAVSFLQEIAADEQEEREFANSLSEVAYEYDKRSKKSRLRKLPRPAWMTVRLKGRLLTKTRLLRAAMPVGNVIYGRGHPVPGGEGENGRE